MASPVADSYTVASGGIIYGGRSAPSVYPNALLNLIAAAPANSWLSVAANTFTSIWPPADYRALFGAGVTDPAAIIRCWSSFAWDDTNYRIIYWGGGHANANDNEVYTWDATTRKWAVAFMPSDTQVVSGGMGVEPVDGPLNAPQSSHTYSSQNWLPVMQRFMTFGGAASSSGGPFQIRTPSLRTGGAYTLNMALAGQNQVGGTTGSNPHRNASLGVNLTGARAWYLRDWFLDFNDTNNALQFFGARTNNISAVRTENGHDTVYFKGGAGYLFRIEMPNTDYHNDIISVVGQPWTSAGQANSGNLDPVRNVFMTLRDSANPMEGFDLNTAGPTNKNFVCPASGFIGTGVTNFTTALGAAVNGLLFDARRDCFIMWGGGGSVYQIKRPVDPVAVTSGWAVTQLSTDALSPRPITYSEMGGSGGEGDTGVSGKWKRSEKLDIYIGVQGSITGNVWVYKPANWVDPRA